MLVVLSAVAATTALLSQQLTLSRAANTVPNEGFYWSVAQYQITHHRLKQELRVAAAGEPANVQELCRYAAVLASMVSILTEPSEFTSLLNGVPSYAAATHRVAELQSRAGPILEKSAFAQADAVKVLESFRAAGDEEMVSQLASDVRLAEITAKESMTQSLSRRIWWAWGGFAFCWAALALWLLYAIRSRRRYRTAAHDRQPAVEAMEQGIVAKRRFLSMVNREVRSPLQNIVASAELLAMKDRRQESVAARCRHTAMPLQFEPLVQLHKSMMAWEAAQSLAHECDTYRELLNPPMCQLLERDMAMDHSTYLQDEQLLAIARRAEHVLGSTCAHQA